MPPSVWTGWWRSFMREATEASRGVVKAANTIIPPDLSQCEERSDEAIQNRRVVLDCFASLAMTS